MTLRHHIYTVYLFIIEFAGHRILADHAANVPLGTQAEERRLCPQVLTEKKKVRRKTEDQPSMPGQQSTTSRAEINLRVEL